MPTAKLYHQQEANTGTVELDRQVFGVTVNPGIIEQAIVTLLANRRAAVAHTKTRGEVRGGGKKPWKQKHTGQARHGSTRSPIWVGGGVVFGPRKTRVWGVKINKKAKKQALKMVLSDKVAENRLVVLSGFDVTEFKTKKVAAILAKLPSAGKKSLVALPAVTEKIWKSAANLPAVSVSSTKSLNVVDLMKNKFLVTTVDGVNSLIKTLS